MDDKILRLYSRIDSTFSELEQIASAHQVDYHRMDRRVHDVKQDILALHMAGYLPGTLRYLKQLEDYAQRTQQMSLFR